MGHSTLSRREILRMMGVGALCRPPSLFDLLFQHNVELCPRPSTLLFIAADSHSSPKVDGQYAPYVTIDGEHTIKYVVDAAEKSVADQIVVVGDEEKLATTLEYKLDSDRIILQQQHSTLVDDVVIRLCQYIRDRYGIETPEEQKWKDIDKKGLNALREDQRLGGLRYAILPANTPLITTDEIDRLLTSVSTPGITVGLTGENALRNAFNELERLLGEADMYEIFARDFLKFRKGREVVVAEPNHFYVGDISALDKEFLTVVRNILLFARKPVRRLGYHAFNGSSLFGPYRNQEATELAEATNVDYESEIAGIKELWRTIGKSRKQTTEETQRNGAVDIHSLQQAIFNLSRIPIKTAISDAWSLLIEVDSEEKASYLREHWNYWRRAQDALYRRNGENVVISS